MAKQSKFNPYPYTGRIVTPQRETDLRGLADVELADDLDPEPIDLDTSSGLPGTTWDSTFPSWSDD